IRATVELAASRLPVLFDTTGFSSVCSDVNHARQHNPTCEHIAALLYAFLREPDTFMPNTLGEYAGIVEKNPASREWLGADSVEESVVLETLKHAPPDLRAALEQLPLREASDHLEKAASLFPALAPETRKVELAARLDTLPLDLLREIARRRGWRFTSSARGELVRQITAALVESPYPAEFSPEELQLLQIENTLFGFIKHPARGALEKTWKKRVGTDPSGLARALSRLQSAGMLFPDAQPGKHGHYYWSPMLNSDDLPLLAPPVKRYPSGKLEHAQAAAPIPPIWAVLEAAIEWAEHTPPRRNAAPRDSRFEALS
ncbi:MAG: hypothetical protein M1482_13475, partial [Chloroflexi bacterium]|nr:hypothetical protein [Chloroflexota bacterium]